jgi:hypothetical protein
MTSNERACDKAIIGHTIIGSGGYEAGIAEGADVVIVERGSPGSKLSR